jgi:hypothetical protein
MERKLIDLDVHKAGTYYDLYFEDSKYKYYISGVDINIKEVIETDFININGQYFDNSSVEYLIDIDLNHITYEILDIEDEIIILSLSESDLNFLKEKLIEEVENNIDFYYQSEEYDPEFYSEY